VSVIEPASGQVFAIPYDRNRLCLVLAVDAGRVSVLSVRRIDGGFEATPGTGGRKRRPSWAPRYRVDGSNPRAMTWELVAEGVADPRRTPCA
jgi:hypothetical protein